MKCDNYCVCLSCFRKENCLGCTVCLHDGELNKVCQFPLEDSKMLDE